MSEPTGGGRGGSTAGAGPPAGGFAPAAVPRGFAMVARDADAYAEPVPRPTTGTLLRRTSSTLTSSFRPLITLSLIVHSPLLVAAAAVLAVAGAGLIPAEALVLAFVVIVFSTIPFSQLSAAALIQAVFETLREGDADVAGSARLAFRRVGPVIGLAILTSLATMGGAMLCLIPGIVVGCGLLVAMPAMLVERIGVGDAFSRSWSLSSGYKLSIFGLLALIWLIEQGIGGVLQVWLNGGFGEELGNLYLYLPALLLFSVFMTTLRGVAAVVAYHDLRQFREGLDEDELAAVFE